ncbi:MAG: hypothetical protein FWC58_02195 [Desulfobulbus sp.]|nr:hypothetical protein [Desulfobulbus sp.]
MNNSVTRIISAILLTALWGSMLGIAQERKDEIADFRAKGYSVVATTPIFSQIVLMSYPSSFRPAHENRSGSQYIQESVPEGETVEKWSQMITLTGAKGLAANPKATPQLLAQQIAGGFQRACPASYSGKGLGNFKVGEHEAFMALAGCGSVQIGPPRSEIALLIVIKGSDDYYTIQWAERGQPLNQPPVLDDSKWSARFKQLNPIKLCNRVPNEQAPYPSCVDQK